MVRLFTFMQQSAKNAKLRFTQEGISSARVQPISSYVSEILEAVGTEAISLRKTREKVAKLSAKDSRLEREIARYTVTLSDGRPHLIAERIQGKTVNELTISWETDRSLQDLQFLLEAAPEKLGTKGGFCVYFRSPIIEGVRKLETKTLRLLAKRIHDSCKPARVSFVRIDLPKYSVWYDSRASTSDVISKDDVRDNRQDQQIPSLCRIGVRLKDPSSPKLLIWLYMSTSPHVMPPQELKMKITRWWAKKHYKRA